MKIQLPLENWADLLPFVPRHQLVEIVKQLNDRQFAKILQFFLTKVGQITLDNLRIVAPRENDPNGGGPLVEVRKKVPPFRAERTVLPPSDVETNLPEGPMPTNIKNFKRIELSYFDESVATFLHQFQQEQQPGNSLLDNVNLWLYSPVKPDDDNTIIMPILARLMPMIGNINSMSICHLRHTGFGHTVLEPNNAAYQPLTAMLTNARILEIRRDYCHKHRRMSSWCNWLYAPRKDGMPRALRFYFYDGSSFQNPKISLNELKRTSHMPPVRSASSFMFKFSIEEMLTDRTFAWTMARPKSDWWSKQPTLLPVILILKKLC